MATKRKYRYKDGESIDPYYKMFLDNLGADGKSYVIQMNKDKEKMKYEPSPRNTGPKKKMKKKSKSKKETMGLDLTKLLSCSSIDPYYRMYLEHLRPRNDSMVPIFNEEEQEPKEQFSCSSVFPYGDDGLFGERLRQCLGEPFCRREYDELMALATQRKPMSRLRHLRKRSASYATQKMGHSLLDDHPDLIKQIERADHREGLTLLRGFFFWITNLSHKGSFKPWKETSPYDLSSCAVID